jgi:hypothetical protein
MKADIKQQDLEMHLQHQKYVCRMTKYDSEVDERPDFSTCLV